MDNKLQIPVNTYFVDLRHRDFVEGKTRTLHTQEVSSINRFIAVIGAIAALPCLWIGLGMLQEAPGAAVMFLVIPALSAILVIGWFVGSQRDKHLSTVGSLQLGEVVNCESKFQQNTEGPDYYLVTLRYSFQNPAGGPVQGVKVIQFSGHEATLPKPGTPVFVIFESMSSYELL